ncbi:MAG: PEP-CTERM sorting domain-containing protein [Verrucomicrobia bacterium]|jgi:hypothetical protein|nr:PEP-CTERM sorting domain-containing protein [Verrucomicrobiota bacterium]
MKKHIAYLGIMAAVSAWVTSARAVPLEVFQVTDPIQDEWFMPQQVHELGTAGFPPGELISSLQVSWNNHIPCPKEYLGGGAVQVRITNLTGQDWVNGVWYVADTPETSLSNWDEWVGQFGFAPGQAFRIDNVGENTPLVYESMAYDNVFQAGETWEFIIQEYSNPRPGSLPSDFASVGLIGGGSLGDFLSTGSIIAVPEPSSVVLIALGGLVLLWRRRR